MRLWCKTCSKEITRDHLTSKEHGKKQGWSLDLMPADFDVYDSDWEKAIEEEKEDKWQAERCGRWRKSEKPALVEQLPMTKEMKQWTKDAVENMTAKERRAFEEAGGMRMIA